MEKRMKNKLEKYVIVCLLAVLVLISGCTQQENAPNEVPPPAEETEFKMPYTVVTPKEAKEMIEQNPDLIIIDDSYPPYYARGHIPNAINYHMLGGGIVKNGSLDEAIPTLDKNKKYLIYSHIEDLSINSALRLTDNGFKNVYRLNGDYSAWVNAGYPVEESEPEKTCLDMCGDGKCQEVVCKGEECPCAETAKTCPKDCSKPVEVKPKPPNETESNQNKTETNQNKTETNQNKTETKQNKTEPNQGKVSPAGVITGEELSIHNYKGNCWIAYEGKVYDITNWIKDKSVYPRCGTINAFEGISSTRYNPADTPNEGILKGTLAAA